MTPAYLSPKQAAEYLNVSATSIYARCASGELRHVRVGKAIRIRPTDLDNLGTEYVFKCLSPAATSPQENLRPALRERKHA
jgi:excisionase family DNA binding protein